MFCGIILRYGTHFVCHTWAAPSEFGTYRLCDQRRFRRACASAQSRQNLRCSLIQAVSQAEPSDGKPDPWRLWMAGHAQLKFVMTECSKTQIRLTRPTCNNNKNTLIVWRYQVANHKANHCFCFWRIANNVRLACSATSVWQENYHSL